MCNCKMIKFAVFLCGVILCEIHPSSSFARLRMEGNRIGGLEDTSESTAVPPTKQNVLGEEEDSDFPEKDNFHPKQMYPNTMGEISTCPRVENRIRTDMGESCPRGWTKLPSCDQPDKRNIGSCDWNEASKFELPNTLADMRAVLCKYKRMKCLGEAGVIPSNTQLVYAPRNALSDKNELAEIMSHLKEVVAVDFARNNFAFLSRKTFESNSCLRSVNFDQNFLLDIPEMLFFHNKLVTSISFLGNKLDYLPPRIFYRNPILTIVNFERNNITLLPPEIFRRNRRLEVVRLTGNGIPKIPLGLFSANPMLREIGLANNRISAVPKMLFHHSTQLRNVRLSGNKIRTLPGHLFDNCGELRTVALDRNMITSLPAKLFYRNPKLSHVDISYNQFHLVSPELFANNPVVSITNSQWDDQQGVFEEQHEDGEWRPTEDHPPPNFYRKRIPSS